MRVRAAHRLMVSMAALLSFAFASLSTVFEKDALFKKLDNLVEDEKD